MKKIYSLLILVFVLFNSACGQNKTVKLDELAFGASVKKLSDSIWVIFQDRDDNYWFGSNGEGVYRFNGKTLTRFTTNEGLTNDSIREIQQDRAGNMYFSTMKGFCKFDGNTITEMLPIIPSDSQGGWKLKPDDLWFKGNSIVNGPYRLDGDSLYDLDFPKHELEDELYSITGKVPWSNNGVYTIYKDSKGNIWFGTTCFGACRFNGKSLTWISEKEITFRTDAFGVRGIIEDEDGWMWLTNTIYRYAIVEKESEGKGQPVIDFKKEKGIGNGECDYFQSIVRDDMGSYWMVTYMGGVWRYNPSGRKWTHYPVMKRDAYIPLVSIYKDHRDVLWLGTQEDGVYRFNGKTFEKFIF
ncbi:MAG TPA: two-component regulator propeller domain-containing protein [Saprospiraceae bacterium]|nr:two-component regulator propeller domain-containing protein [Saprospiraceae bacterium]